MINPVAFQVFGHDIRWYGIIMAVALLLGILVAMYHTKRQGHDPDSILDLALIIVPLAVICARAYYVIFQWKEIYAGQPFWHVFAVWEGGLAIYGGIIGGFLGILIFWKYLNKGKITLYGLLDIAAPSLILGQAIGRWGNFVNQEAYGAAVYNTAWQWFPASVYISNPSIAGEQPGWYMATFFYESMWNFLVFAFLFFYFKNSKKRKPGNVFWFYLLLYGIGRCVIEGMREDSLYWGTVRVSQLLSVLLVLASAMVLIIQYLQERRKRLEATPLNDSLKLHVEIGEEETPTNGGSESNEDKPAGEEPQEEHPVTAEETVAALVEEDPDDPAPEEPENKEG